jgi:hypothetical protein
LEKNVAINHSFSLVFHQMSLLEAWHDGHVCGKRTRSSRGSWRLLRPALVLHGPAEPENYADVIATLPIGYERDGLLIYEYAKARDVLILPPDAVPDVDALDVGYRCCAQLVVSSATWSAAPCMTYAYEAADIAAIVGAAAAAGGRGGGSNASLHLRVNGREVVCGRIVESVAARTTVLTVDGATLPCALILAMARVARQQFKARTGYANIVQTVCVRTAPTPANDWPHTARIIRHLPSSYMLRWHGTLRIVRLPGAHRHPPPLYSPPIAAPPCARLGCGRTPKLACTQCQTAYCSDVCRTACATTHACAAVAAWRGRREACFFTS